MALHPRLFFLLLVLLPTQIGLHFWPEWAHVLGRRVDYLSPTVFLSDILIFAILVTWIWDIFRRTKHSKQQIRASAVRIVVIVVPLAIFAMINIAHAHVIPVAVYKWIKVIELTFLGLYVVGQRPKINTVVYGVSIGVLYSSILAVLQFLFQHSIGGGLWLLGERTFALDTPGIARLNLCIPSRVMCELLLRPYATFPHPNVLGGFLAVTIPLMLFYIHAPLPNITRHLRMYMSIVVLTATIALLLTFSRSAWIAAIVGAGATYALLFRNAKRQVRHVYVFMLVWIIVVATVVSVMYRYHPFGADESFFGRVDLAATAYSMWSHSPFVGVGLGNFLTELPDTSLGRQINFLQPVHNIYLLVLAEAGIFGLGIFLYFIGNLIYRSRGRSFLLSLLCLLLLGFVDHYAFTVQQGQVLFVVLAALTYSARPRF